MSWRGAAPRLTAREVALALGVKGWPVRRLWDLHHREPVGAGGAHRMGNIETRCQACHGAAAAHGSARGGEAALEQARAAAKIESLGRAGVALAGALEEKYGADAAPRMPPLLAARASAGTAGMEEAREATVRQG